MTDAEAATAMPSRLIGHARDQGYRRTEIPALRIESLADGLALVAGTYVRLDAQGGEIGRFGFKYVMRNAGTGWRIVVALAHGVEPPSA